jgi:general secretion pathway protein J
VTEIQRGMRVVAQDFAQIIARAARDTSGTGQLMPAVTADARDNTLLTFTRAGWSNPAGLPRPAEQRVRYRFIDGALVREHWLAVDPALNVEPRQRVLLTKVKAVEVRFLDPVTRNWRNDWPVNAPSGPVSPAQIDLLLLTRPLAIEFTVVLDDWGRVQRLFEIPT